MALTIYTPEDLDPIVAEGTQGFATPAAWVLTLACSVADMVKRNPSTYLSFGPYWWPLKAIMQREGFLGGEPVDTHLLEQVALPTDALNCAAAFAFHEGDFHFGGRRFLMWNEADGGAVDFILADDDFEVW